MSRKKIAINGFGRIGRLVFRLLHNHPDVEVVAVNDLADNATLIHLLRFDTAQGKFPGTATTEGEYLVVNGHKILGLAERDPEQLPWDKLGVDIVIECTGLFRSRDKATKHLTAGAKRVVISAPAKGDIKTIVLGVNDALLEDNDTIISNASCTTNCLAPMVKILEENFGIEKAFVTTVHAYTADQRLQDAPHEDLRRARAAAQNIVPTTTNAGTALGEVMPGTKGKIFASALRVPVIAGSITELNVLLKAEATVEKVNSAFQNAAETHLKGILEYTEDEIVSSDIVGNPASCIFDSKLTLVEGNFIKITGWYDNESGYSNRLADLVLRMGSL
ncbi:type I glyceraldehyde-3-phosphate dehydrogenase [soil metagenome]